MLDFSNAFWEVLSLFVIHGVILIFLPSNRDKNTTKGKTDKLGVRVARVIIVISLFALTMPFAFLVSDIPITCQVLGLIGWIVSTTLLITARLTLKTNFNESPVVSNGHQLIQHGVYSFVRHPIYLSYVISWISLSLLTLNWLFFILVGITVLRILIRIKQEEIVLVDQFGEAYHNYMNKTGAVFPRIKFYNT